MTVSSLASHWALWMVVLCDGDCGVGGGMVVISGMVWVSAIMRRRLSWCSGLSLMFGIVAGVFVVCCAWWCVVLMVKGGSCDPA